MKKINFISLCSLLAVFGLPQTGYLQKEANVWHFGIHRAYSFNPPSTGPAVLISNISTSTSSSIENYGGSGCVSSANGSLLFYTDAVKIWGNDHLEILDGTGIPDEIAGDRDNMGVAIAKQPYYSVALPYRNYIVFTVDGDDQLRYTVVQKGTFPSTPPEIVVKNQLVSGSFPIPMSQKMAITNASDCNDVWVVTHNYGTEFYAFRITPTGISTPVVSDISAVEVPKMSSTHKNIGCMKISPDGTLLAMNYQTQSIDHCALFKFDNSTGVVTGMTNETDPYILEFVDDNNQFTPDLQSPNQMTSYPYQYLGVEFSPDSKILYTCAKGTGTGFFDYNARRYGYGCGYGFGSIQMNVTSLVPATMRSSMRIAAPSSYGMMQLGPDGRIYIGEGAGSSYPVANPLSAIEFPNRMNTTCSNNECGYNIEVVDNPSMLVDPDGSPIGYGLPLFNSGFFNGITPPTISISPDDFCVESTITLTATADPGVTVEWREGSCSNDVIGTGISITLPAPSSTTTYYARVVNSCGYVSLCTPFTFEPLSYSAGPDICIEPFNSDLIGTAGSTANIYTIAPTMNAVNNLDGTFSITNPGGPDMFVAYIITVVTPDSCTVIDTVMVGFTSDPCHGRSVSISTETEFTTIPNPSDGNFTIQGLKPYSFISIMDAKGSIIFTAKTRQETNLPISLTSLAKGLYIVTIHDGTLSKSSRIIIK